MQLLVTCAFLVLNAWLSGASASCYNDPNPILGATLNTNTGCFASDLTTAATRGATGWPTGTACAFSCSSTVVWAYCLTGGDWTTPVCNVAPQTAGTLSGSTNLATNNEYASMITLSGPTTVASVVIPFDMASPPTGAHPFTISFYTMDGLVGETNGPKDLIYSATGTFDSTAASGTIGSTGLFGLYASATGLFTVDLASPVNIGLNTFVSFSTAATMAGAITPQCTHAVGGSTTAHLWHRTAGGAWEDTSIPVAAAGCVVSAVNTYSSFGDACEPPLLTSTIGYSGTNNGFDTNEPAMPFMDSTHSTISGTDLVLAFTYPTAVYDDVQFLPSIGTCTVQYAVQSVASSGCETTMLVHANFLSLISTAGACGWTLSSSNIQYQGVTYTQWAGKITVNTFQTVAVAGGVSQRSKTGSAYVVVRSPVAATSAVPTSPDFTVLDAATFQWTVSSQSLDTSSAPYHSVTQITTVTSGGYQLTGATVASLLSQSLTPWGAATITGPSGTCAVDTTCVQTWTLTVSQSDTHVCSLDAAVGLSFTFDCNVAMTESCTSPMMGSNTFSADLQLSSDDYCPKLGGSTALSLVVKAVDASPDAATWTSSSLLGTAIASVTATPLFATNTPIGVYGQVTSNPGPLIPMSVASVSAVLRDFADQSQSTSYSGIFGTSSGPYFYADEHASAGYASFAFDLPTGARTPWLVTGTSQSHSVVLSVSVTVSYSAPASSEPIIVTLDVPLKPNGRGGFEPLAQTGHSDGAADTIVPSTVATVTGTTSLTIGDSVAASPSSTSMTPGVIAGIAVGSAAALILIVVVIGVLLRQKKVAYQPPAAAPAEAASQV